MYCALEDLEVRVVCVQCQRCDVETLGGVLQRTVPHFSPGLIGLANQLPRLRAIQNMELQLSKPRITTSEPIRGYGMRREGQVMKRKCHLRFGLGIIGYQAVPISARTVISIGRGIHIVAQSSSICNLSPSSYFFAGLLFLFSSFPPAFGSKAFCELFDAR